MEDDFAPDDRGRDAEDVADAGAAEVKRRAQSLSLSGLQRRRPKQTCANPQRDLRRDSKWIDGDVLGAKRRSDGAEPAPLPPDGSGGKVERGALRSTAARADLVRCLRGGSNGCIFPPVMCAIWSGYPLRRRLALSGSCVGSIMVPNASYCSFSFRALLTASEWFSTIPPISPLRI